ncbi:unnamed protein product [Trichobilharzia regenti]|nr:unnamed protein product [Trichobilharzia regenti]
MKLGTILTTLNATDADTDPRNSLITYTSKFSESNLFSVNSRNDPEGFSCTFNLKIIVLDVNDNPPVFDAIEINAIPEDAPLGSLVGKINARDLDSEINTAKLKIHHLLFFKWVKLCSEAIYVGDN